MHPIQLLQDSFSKGFETYDPKTKLTSNVGGIKLWWESNWKKMERIFLAESLFNAVKDLPLSLYVMSRARLGENGRALVNPNGNGVIRESIGLMFYTQFNMTPKAAEMAVSKIITEIPILEGYVMTGMQASKDAPAITDVTKISFQEGNNRTHIRLEGCVFIVAPSGSEQSSQFWGYKNKSADQKSANQRTIAPNEVIDLTNLA